jgi:hypothetical protein
MKDMGRVMATVRERHASSIEPARASALVKAALASKKGAPAEPTPLEQSRWTKTIWQAPSDHP